MERNNWFLTIIPKNHIEPASVRVRQLIQFAARELGLRCVIMSVPAEIQRLQAIVDGLADRVAAQAELLARAAMRDQRVIEMCCAEMCFDCRTGLAVERDDRGGIPTWAHGRTICGATTIREGLAPKESEGFFVRNFSGVNAAEKR